MDLINKHCVPCEGGESPLSLSEIALYEPSVPEWIVAETKGHPVLERIFVLKNFVDALSFVNRVAKVAESEGHHPNILIFNYKKVKITLFTHAINGLHLNDFILARKIDLVWQTDRPTSS